MTPAQKVLLRKEIARYQNLINRLEPLQVHAKTLCDNCVKDTLVDCLKTAIEALRGAMVQKLDQLEYPHVTIG